MKHLDWTTPAYDRVLEWNMTLSAMTEDLVEQLKRKSCRIHRSLQANYLFDAIAMSSDGSRFARILSDDVREGTGWLERIRVYRLDGNREIIEDSVVICDWDNVGEEVAKMVA